MKISIIIKIRYIFKLSGYFRSYISNCVKKIRFFFIFTEFSRRGRRRNGGWKYPGYAATTQRATKLERLVISWNEGIAEAKSQLQRFRTDDWTA